MIHELVLRNIQQTLAINLIYGMMDKRINNLGHILGFTRKDKQFEVVWSNFIVCSWYFVWIYVEPPY